jgi:pyruvate dehydrogenase E2 component (dihydrolipoamide acetyltransferase)
MDFRLPELGEGIFDATVVNVPAKPGQPIKAGEPIIEVETDKAAVPITHDADVVVKEFKVKVGDKVKVGALVATFASNGEAAAKPAPVAAKPESKKESAPTAAAAPAAGGGRHELPLPNLGEGIESGIVVAVSIKIGDSVKKDQELFSVETDKAAIPISADVDGKVEEIKVKVGDKVTPGKVLVVLSAASGANSSSAPTAEAPKAAASKSAPAAAPVATAPKDNGSGVVHSSGVVPAGPATRHYAREHSVNLAEVPGTARGGRITVDDVKTHIRKRMNGAGGGSSSGGGFATHNPLPDFSKYGPIEKKPLSNIRKKIAENLTATWHTIPAVTQYDLADITDLEAGRKRIVEAMPKGSPKVTMTVLAIKAVVAALKEFPNFNSALDLANGEVVVKQYYHIGIAVDTERGLVVPVIRDADKKSIRDLAADVANLAELARTGKLTIDQMRGGTFTITNLGGVGGTAFSPIINYPEVAILGLSRSAIQPVYRNDTFVPRLLMPLCLTYDHRIIDGADGARFTTRLVQLFSDPIRLLMES